jgi:deazaflavin-dependent oxidoreductase (nitroreductase family)
MNMFKITGAVHVALFRASSGRIGGRLRGAPVLLLTTKGRKTGKERTTPLLYLEDGNRLVVVASKGGAPSHPAWFLNLQANPEVTVERGKGKSRYRARAAEGEERDALWSRVVAMYGSYADYQEKTSREIPVVVLEPVD